MAFVCFFVYNLLCYSLIPALLNLSFIHFCCLSLCGEFWQQLFDMQVVFIGHYLKSPVSLNLKDHCACSLKWTRIHFNFIQWNEGRRAPAAGVMCSFHSFQRGLCRTLSWDLFKKRKRNYTHYRSSSTFSTTILKECNKEIISHAMD